MDILNAKFMCNHAAKGLLIYTYNPYTNHAPDSWQVEKTVTKRNDDALTLFFRRYSGNDEVCTELDFDKTNDLGGHEIRASTKDLIGWWQTDVNKTGVDSFGGFLGVIYKIVFLTLNATPKLLLNSPEVPMGLADADGNADGLIGQVVHEVTDIMLPPRFYEAMGNLTSTYPYWQGGLSAISKPSGFQSQLQKIKTVIDKPSRFGVLVVCVITLIFLKCVMHQNLGSAILNVVRLICNTSLMQLLDDLPSRIYLACLFILVVTIQAIYAGKLASLLTKQQALPNINTMDDLRQSTHIVHAYKAFTDYFREPAFDGRLIEDDDGDCGTRPVNETTLVCIHETTILIECGLILSLHVSSEILVSLHIINVIRSDWPLQERIDLTLSRMNDAGLVKFLYMKNHKDLFRAYEIYKKGDEDQTFKVMTMKDLSFAFVILGIGLAFACIAFVVEKFVVWN